MTTTSALLSFLPPDVALTGEVDGRVLAFTAAVVAATAVLFGVLPALQASRTQPADVLKEQQSNGETFQAACRTLHNLVKSAREAIENGLRGIGQVPCIEIPEGEQGQSE